MRAALIPKGPAPAPSDTATCSVWCENNHQFSAARLRAGRMLAPLSGLPWPSPPRISTPPVCADISRLMPENSVEVRVSSPLSPSPLHQRTWPIVSRVCSWSQDVHLSVCLEQDQLVPRWEAPPPPGCRESPFPATGHGILGFRFAI